MLYELRKSNKRMGIGQSTHIRIVPDYIYAHIHVDDTGYVHLNLFVNNTENALKCLMIMRESDDRLIPSLPPQERPMYWPEPFKYSLSQTS